MNLLAIVFATFALGVDVVIEGFPEALIALGCIAVSLAAAWFGLLRRGIARLIGIGIAVVAFAGAAIVLIARGDALLQAAGVVAGVVLTPVMRCG